LIIGVDSQPAQIEWAKRRHQGERIAFYIADAHQLPFDDDTFDVVSSALVLNFLADRSKALAEMQRVGQPGAVVAGYVWDFATEKVPNSCLCLGLRKLGVTVPRLAGSSTATLTALTHSFRQADYREIRTETFDVTVAFKAFEEFWQSQTPGFSPITKMIAALPPPKLEELMDIVRKLTTGPTGTTCWSARAHAISARIP
jgi:ubiquinone/menaquinone biosynthesis C-methylase UbiE